MRKFNVKVLEVKEEPTREYNDWLDRRLENTVWAKGSSFYRLGKNRNGRIFVSVPASEYHWGLVSPDIFALIRPIGPVRLRCTGGKILHPSGKTGSAPIKSRLQPRASAGEC